ncbi:ribonuclease H-like domain-containing protein [Rhizophagus clarus]|uniref:Ribonuclease H-like domain-containing protein n=1 Tax=Rhizophagus clarus TaxID=94130 RepID=A0A8H3QQ69_9GLOM|nr:ribonuclease H-like domain-containing protein [Rhizophagus clarus]
MGIGWHMIQPSTLSPITFSGFCKHFPSSTKAEADIGNRQKFNVWLDYTTNSVLKQASFHQQIDWSMTEEFFKYNLHDRPTSHKLTKFRAWQRKMVNNLLPTMDILYRRYPTLFKDKRTCWTCDQHEETNDSLWLCSVNLEILCPHIVQFIQDLKTDIRQTCDYGDSLLEQELNNNSIFKFFLQLRGNLPLPTTNSIFYLTARQIITHDFSYIFREKYKHKKTLHNKILSKFYELTQLIKRIIWKPRNDTFKKWKVAQWITKHSYKQYRRKTKKTRSHTDHPQQHKNEEPTTRYHFSNVYRNTDFQFYQIAFFRSL